MCYVFSANFDRANVNAAVGAVIGTEVSADQIRRLLGKLQDSSSVLDDGKLVYDSALVCRRAACPDQFADTPYPHPPGGARR